MLTNIPIYKEPDYGTYVQSIWSFNAIDDVVISFKFLVTTKPRAGGGAALQVFFKLNIPQHIKT